MPRNPPEQYRFKKGQSGNPEGGRKHNPEIRKIRNLTLAETVEVGSLVLKGSVDDLRLIIKDPASSALKCMIASVAIKTITKGDPHALEVLLNRLIGKAKEQIELSGVDGKPIETVASVIVIPSNGREVKEK